MLPFYSRVSGGYEVKRLMQIGAGDAKRFGERRRLCKQRLHASQLFFAQKPLVAFCDEAAFALDGFDEARFLQIGVGSLGGNDAYAEPVCERADRWQLLATRQRARQDVRSNLRGDLLVDGFVARVG